MVHFIIDGYNALFRIKPLLKKQYKTREGFIRYIKISKPYGSIRNKVSLVFDGTTGVTFNPKIYLPFNVFFTKGENADDMIVEMVKMDKRPQDIIVVTDDRELQDRVKIYDSKAIGVLRFFKNLKKDGKTTKEEKPDINSKEAKDITEEMKKIWGIYQ